MDAPHQLSPEEIASAVAELQRQLATTAAADPQRIDCTPETLDKGLARLVLGLIDLLRRLLERQAIRRMEGGSLTNQQIEDMGQALMTLETKLQELAGQFGLSLDDLNLDLGPLGRLHDGSR